VNRTVGVTLRRTVGGGAIFALGFGALSSPPQRPIEVAAAATALPLTSPSDQLRPIKEIDEPMARQAYQAAAKIYVLATPAAVTAVTPRRVPATVRPVSRPAARAPQARAVGTVSGAANGFSYGYCTWWVAHKRSIPWRGNAAQWWWNARSFGFAEGSSPQTGAIMVMGVSGSSPQGHVAYVESVNANGSFVVSEMNWWGVPGGGWSRVDYRTVTSMRGVLGFIY
jgi:peptidoglycan DL-endopeptidase CwlO